MYLSKTFDGVVIGVIGASEIGVNAHILFFPGDLELIDGSHVEDNGFIDVPNEPGVYHCKVEMWVSRGTYEYPDDADYEFRIIEAARVYSYPEITLSAESF